MSARCFVRLATDGARPKVVLLNSDASFAAFKARCAEKLGIGSSDGHDITLLMDSKAGRVEIDALEEISTEDLLIVVPTCECPSPPSRSLKAARTSAEGAGQRWNHSDSQSTPTSVAAQINNRLAASRTGRCSVDAPLDHLETPEEKPGVVTNCVDTQVRCLGAPEEKPRLSPSEQAASLTSSELLSGATKDQLSQITKINLKRKEIDDAVAEALAAGMPRWCCGRDLETLEISHNRIGGSGVVALVATLRTWAPGLQTLWLDYNAIGTVGAECLCEWLTSAHDAPLSLHTLGIGYNKLGDAGAAAMSKALERNRTLTQLRLRGNGIGDAGAAMLAAALSSSNSSLKKLLLKENRISETGQGALRAAAPVHLTFVELACMVVDAASAVATASTLASAAVNLLTGRPRSTLLILSCNHRLPASETEAAAVHALHPSSQRLIDPSAEQAAAAVGAHDWVHFCGHADPRLGTDRVLVWCKDGELDAVAASTLVNMLRGKRLVVLNGCCSDELGCKLIQAGGVQHVVCWETKLKDVAGPPFAEGFWRAMVGHESDDDATFRAAVRAAFEAGRTGLLSVTKPQASALDVGQGEYRAANVPKFALVDPSHGARTPRGEIAAGVPLLLLCPPLTSGIPAVPDLYYGLTL